MELINRFIMKNIFKHSFLVVALLSFILTTIQAQTVIRPYNEWEATQFVAVSGHQPEDYVLADNNWEILYNLRKPHTQSELHNMGIKWAQLQISVVYFCSIGLYFPV